MKMLCRVFWARLSLLVLLYLSGAAPLHLAEEIHALLPASAQHHAQIHCEEPETAPCDQPDDDLSKPLSGEQHERHHEAQCHKDGAFSFVEGAHHLSVKPSQWNSIALDFVPVAAPLCLDLPVCELRGRAPPSSDHKPRSIFSALRSGRAPPVLV